MTASPWSGACANVSARGEQIVLWPIKPSDSRPFDSEPVRFAVAVNTPASSARYGIALGQCGITRFDGCATTSAPPAASVAMASGKNQSKQIITPRRYDAPARSARVQTGKPVSPGAKCSASS